VCVVSPRPGRRPATRAEDWTLRFDLIALDEKTQERATRPSGHLFAAIAAENGLTRALVEGYAPEVVGEVFENHG